MNKKELKELEYEHFQNKIPLLTDIYIVPTRYKHDSGYKIMDIYGINRATGYKKLIDGCCDVVQFGEIFTESRGLNDCVRMDTLGGGVLHLFTFGSLFKVECRLSDFSFILVKASKDYGKFEEKDRYE